VLNEGMTDVATQMAKAVVQAYDFSSYSTIVDVGGRYGTFPRTVVMSDETNLVDLWNLRQGSRFSIDHLWPELATLDWRGYRSFTVPIFFLLGRHDWQMPAPLAATYFDTIDASCKQLVWFEPSGHYPPFEEPVKFERVLIEQVLPLGRTGARTCATPDTTP
jgi:pimeloyl-ACP methyl ester carboxylesterase